MVGIKIWAAIHTSWDRALTLDTPKDRMFVIQNKLYQNSSPEVNKEF